MGSLLGLGMKRGKIGDIQVLEDGRHTVVAKRDRRFFIASIESGASVARIYRTTAIESDEMVCDEIGHYRYYRCLDATGWYLCRCAPIKP